MNQEVEQMYDKSNPILGQEPMRNERISQMNTNFTLSTVTTNLLSFQSPILKPTYEGEMKMETVNQQPSLLDSFILALDNAHKSREHFITFLNEIEVPKDKPWAAEWIRTYWTDGAITDYMTNGYNGLVDYDILEHMSLWLRDTEIKRGQLIH